MGRLVHATVSGVLVLGLVMAGCGGSSSTSSSTQAASAGQTSSSQTGTSAGADSNGTQTSAGASSTPTTTTTSEHVPRELLQVSSPAFKEGAAIAARYTCDGADVSPPLRWSVAPRGTVELALFISDFEGTAPGGGELISWAVAGLRPTLTGIGAGSLPAGAVVGRNSFGQARYTVCPPKGSRVQHYIVALYALPHPLGARPGFSADALAETAVRNAEYSGLAGFSYKRK